jgi:hypothetical protein
MMFHLKKLTLTLAAAALPIGAAQAALHDRGRGLIYDDVMNITWMADSNYAITSGFFESQGIAVHNGQVEWYDAMLWANTLEYGGYDHWRLASPLNRDGSGPQYECNVAISCDDSELGYMFYRNLEVPYYAGGDRIGLLGARNTLNLALFKNLQPRNYWTNLREGFSFAYVFDFGVGHYSVQYVENPYNVLGLGIPWAVRDGDVIDLSPVPEPQTAALMFVGLGLAGWAARRKRQAAIV